MSEMFSRYGFHEDQFAVPERDTFDMQRLGGQEGATLFLYGPTINKFNQTALYTRTYNFDAGTFAHNLEPVINAVVDSNGARGASVGMGVNPYDQFTFSQRPNLTLEGELLSQNWTFTLVFTGKSNRISSQHLITTSVIGGLDRTIYTGICEDIPVYENAGRTLINENCVLRVLHKTKAAITTTSNRQGTEYGLSGKNSDWVFDETLFNSLTTKSGGDMVDHMLTPAKIAMGVRCDDGSFYTAGGLNTEIKQDAKLVASDMVDDHKTHLSTVTRGVSELLKFREHSRSVFADADFLPTHDADNPDYISDQFSSALHIPTSGLYSESDLDLTGKITMGTLDRQFKLNVIPKTFDEATQYSADSVSNGIINKLSYELGTLTGIGMNRLGIANVQYVFSTETLSDGHKRDRFLIQDIGFIYPIAAHDAKRLRDLLETELRLGILKKIRKVLNDDYHVIVRSNSADITTIRLNPLSQVQKNPNDYVIPNLLGGLVSATIGSTADSHHNVNRLCDLAAAFSGGVDPDIKAFDAAFGNTSQSGSWDQDLGLYSEKPQAPPSAPVRSFEEPTQSTPSAPRAPVAPSNSGNWDWNS